MAMLLLWPRLSIANLSTEYNRQKGFSHRPYGSTVVPCRIGPVTVVPCHMGLVTVVKCRIGPVTIVPCHVGQSP